MEVKEFGSDNSMKIVMIPGNMMCWKQFEHVIYREYTIANGDGVCDYWVVGDKVKNPK